VQKQQFFTFHTQRISKL